MGQAIKPEPNLEHPVVLVVDDEQALRLLATDLFEEAGLAAVEARNAAEALNTLEQRSDIALLFTDCQMPGMSGPDLARVASNRWPHLRVVLVTGFQERCMLDWPLIWKPYSGRTIERIVELVLAPQTVHAVQHDQRPTGPGHWS